MSNITELIKAGLHLGNKTNQMHPNMLKYIRNEINGIQYLDLIQTLKLLNNASKFVYNASKNKKTILFIGTKRYSAKLVEQMAKNSNSHYINYRWLGGILTNWRTIETQIIRLRKLKQQKSNGLLNLLHNKESSINHKKLKRLEKHFEGIQDMNYLPDIIITVHQQYELLAIKEARKLNIPIISIIDTDGNPDLVDFPIPANDDSFTSIKLILETLSNSINEGRSCLL
jgi:small subunit ribosomal protein S2